MKRALFLVFIFLTAAVFLGYGKSLGLTFIVFFGYIVAPIRLYTLPVFLPVLVLAKELLSRRTLSEATIILSLCRVAVPVLILIFLKSTFPLIGRVSRPTVEQGFKTMGDLILSGRFDFLFYPFLNLEKMLIPFWFLSQELVDGYIQRLPNFIPQLIPILLLGLIFMAIFGYRLKLYKNVVCILVLILFLRLLVSFQGQWGLNIFGNFAWTYIRLLFVILILLKTITAALRKDKSDLYFYLVSIVALITFLFPEQNNPLIMFPTSLRYLAFPSVGLALLLGLLLDPEWRRPSKFKDSTRILFLMLVVVINLLSLNLRKKIYLHL